jgi:2-iminobutanoate/2-iminopropanoate deaminase
MSITPIHSRELKPEYNMPFVPVFAVENRKLLFLAGCGPIPPYHKHPHVPEEEAVWMEGGIQRQTEKTFKHIHELLAAAGGGLENIVKMTIFLKSISDQDVVNAVSHTVFRNLDPPPRTVVEVSSLNHEGMLIEIDVIGAV